MMHILKIKECYMSHILEGIKTFEIRKNDRDFQVGDTIKFLISDEPEQGEYDYFQDSPVYRINYVLADFNGLQPGWVGLAITPVKKQAMSQ